VEEGLLDGLWVVLWSVGSFGMTALTNSRKSSLAYISCLYSCRHCHHAIALVLPRHPRRVRRALRSDGRQRRPDWYFRQLRTHSVGVIVSRNRSYQRYSTTNPSPRLRLTYTAACEITLSAQAYGRTKGLRCYKEETSALRCQHAGRIPIDESEVLEGKSWPRYQHFRYAQWRRCASTCGALEPNTE